MLDFSHPLFICLLLLLLIRLVALHWGLITIRWSMWVKYSYVKESLLSVISTKNCQLQYLAMHHFQNELFCDKNVHHLLTLVVARSRCCGKFR